MSTPAVAFPAAPAEYDNLTAAVLDWAQAQGVAFPAPQERADSYRAALDLGADQLDVSGPRWRAYATHVLAEYIEDSAGEAPSHPQRRQMARLVAMFGAVRVLAALGVAMAAPLDESRWSFVEAVLRYAAAVLRSWGAQARTGRGAM